MFKKKKAQTDTLALKGAIIETKSHLLWVSMSDLSWQKKKSEDFAIGPPKLSRLENIK